MVMYDEFETKENKIEPQFQYGEEVRGENKNNNNNNNNNNFITFQILAFQYSIKYVKL